MKTDKEIRKINLVNDIMEHINTSYKPTNPVYQRAEHGLMKLTLRELDAIWAITL